MHGSPWEGSAYFSVKLQFFHLSLGLQKRESGSVYFPKREVIPRLENTRQLWESDAIKYSRRKFPTEWQVAGSAHSQKSTCSDHTSIFGRGGFQPTARYNQPDRVHHGAHNKSKEGGVETEARVQTSRRRGCVSPIKSWRVIRRQFLGISGTLRRKSGLCGVHRGRSLHPKFDLGQ